MGCCCGAARLNGGRRRKLKQVCVRHALVLVRNLLQQVQRDRQACAPPAAQQRSHRVRPEASGLDRYARAQGAPQRLARCLTSHAARLRQRLALCCCAPCKKRGAVSRCRTSVRVVRNLRVEADAATRPQHRSQGSRPAVQRCSFALMPATKSHEQRLSQETHLPFAPPRRGNSLTSCESTGAA